jgi:hypothetical protein
MIHDATTHKIQLEIALPSTADSTLSLGELEAEKAT